MSPTKNPPRHRNPGGPFQNDDDEETSDSSDEFKNAKEVKSS
jgi:hypothetical protein